MLQFFFKFKNEHDQSEDDPGYPKGGRVGVATCTAGVAAPLASCARTGVVRLSWEPLWTYKSSKAGENPCFPSSFPSPCGMSPPLPFPLSTNPAFFTFPGAGRLQIHPGYVGAGLTWGWRQCGKILIPGSRHRERELLTCSHYFCP